MLIVITIIMLLVLIGGVLYMVYILTKKKKESEEEKKKFVPITQDQLPFEYVRGGVVKLKKGGYRMVVELPSINIDLMEASEKETILQQYREILNSIDFPFQYLQQSRTVDISEYIETLKRIQRTTKSKFIHSQLEFYSSYLLNLIKNRSILTKKFYLAVTFDEEKDLKNLKTKVKEKSKHNKKKTAVNTEESNDVYQEEQRFERARKQLWTRASSVERMFKRFDITPKILNDKELLELFYTSYNKDRSVYQPLKGKDPADFSTLRVKAERGTFDE